MYFSIEDNEGNWLESGANSTNRRNAINEALGLQVGQIDSRKDARTVQSVIANGTDEQAEDMLSNFGLSVVEHEVKNLDFDFDDDTY